MANYVEINEIVQYPAGGLVAGASVEIRNRSTLALATVYQDEAATVTRANPLTTDAVGRIDGWLPIAQYSMLITPPAGSGLMPWTQYFEASSGGAAAPGYGSTLPSSPTDGQNYYYVADSSKGVVWKLRYNASGGTYKWECYGGTPLFAIVETAATRGPNTYGDPASGSAGPSVTLPLAGDYMVEAYATVTVQNTGADTVVWCAVKFGAAATADADGWLSEASSTGNWQGEASGHRRRYAALAASTVLKMEYRCDPADPPTTDPTFAQRILLVRPIRVG